MSLRCGSNLELSDSKLLGFNIFSYYKGTAINQAEVMRFFPWTTGNEKGEEAFKKSLKEDSVGLQN